MKGMKRKSIAGIMLALIMVCTNASYVGAINTLVVDYQHLSNEERVAIIGKACQKDYQKTGILASVSAAQCILESGYMTTDLAVEANNCFGMKASLSGNSWQSIWDGVSTYNKNTHEEYNGQDVVINADFRKYISLEDSIADHSAYLLGAKSDSGYRYAGLAGEKDYRTAITIIKNGGYATDSGYVDKICSIIERFQLTQFDLIDNTVLESNIANNQVTQENQSATSNIPNPDFQQTYRMAAVPEVKEENVEIPQQIGINAYDDKYYRVRKTWQEEESQIGAFYNLNYAKRACQKGYTVFDSQGKIVYINK